ncbi:hypothetical protein [Bdellovibrio sp. HCB337]|uniref:hypothetical protein n=1 Tax=Bdellovibrio sp. HCB337 TaxID=3394358 RepID=UPI0039A5411E
MWRYFEKSVLFAIVFGLYVNASMGAAPSSLNVKSEDCPTKMVPDADFLGAAGKQNAGVCYSYTAADLIKYKMRNNPQLINKDEVIPPEYLAQKYSRKHSENKVQKNLSNAADTFRADFLNDFSKARSSQNSNDAIKDVFKKYHLPAIKPEALQRPDVPNIMDFVMSGVGRRQLSELTFNYLKELGPIWKSPLNRYKNFQEMYDGEIDKMKNSVPEHDALSFTAEMLGLDREQSLQVEGESVLLTTLREEYANNFINLDGGFVNETLEASLVPPRMCVLNRSEYDAVNNLSGINWSEKNPEVLREGICKTLAPMAQSQMDKTARDIEDIVDATFRAIQRQNAGKITALDEDPKDQLISKLVQRVCADRQREFPKFTSHTAEVESSGDLIGGIKYLEPSSSNAKRSLLDLLRKNQPVGISYSTEGIVKKGRENHASVALGMNWNRSTNQCEVVIRNSWGDRCDVYAKPENCNNGYVRVPIDELKLQNIDWID